MSIEKRDELALFRKLSSLCENLAVVCPALAGKQRQQGEHA